MNVLVVEPDPSFRQFLQRSIESDGHQVVAVPRHSEGVTAVSGGNIDAVLVGLEPGNAEVADAVREIRSAAGQAPLQALLYSAFYEADDPELRVLLRLFFRAQFLPKPFTTADLRDRLGRLMGGGPITLGPVASGPLARPSSSASNNLVHDFPRITAPLPVEEMPALAPPRTSQVQARVGGVSPARAPDLRNALKLTRIWATRATGVAALTGGPNNAHGWATVSRGGPADPESYTLLEAALYGGDLTFEATPVNVQGDWDAMGHLLFASLRDASQGRFAQENRFQALHRTNASHLAVSLPISLGTRRLIARADGQTTLGELLAREGVDASEVSLDLYVLRLLRLVEVAEPVASPVVMDMPAQPSSPGPQSGGYGTSSTTSGSALRSSRMGATTPPRSHSTPPGASRPGAVSSESGRRSSGGASAVVAGPAPIHHRPPHGPTTQGPNGPTTLHSMSNTRTALPSQGTVSRATRSMPTTAATPSASNSAVANARGQISQVLLRLRREEHDLREASPAVVLGVPATAESELVRQAAERMRARYTAMSKDDSLPAEGRTLAASILGRIDEAERGFGRARRDAAVKVDEEMLLTFAREQIGRRNWEQAEKALRRARQIRSDHPSVLANLGWVILSNPSRPAEERTEEARELLLLAEQFDLHNADGQLYLAELLYRLGDYAAALPRAERAAKATPENSAAITLARRLKAKLTQPG